MVANGGPGLVLSGVPIYAGRLDFQWLQDLPRVTTDGTLKVQFFHDAKFF